MEKSNFTSPAYDVQKINIDDLVSQKSNPNSMTEKSFKALQTSIFNTGYTFPVIISDNEEYDPTTEGLPKPSLLEHVDNGDGNVSNFEAGAQVADDEIGKYFKYRLIDGAHRCMVIRQGKYWFDTKFSNKAEDWSNNKNIPEEAGPEMLAYLAWRENFCVPCVLLHLDSSSAMSAEILHNTARGAHSLDSMKDIVYNLINVAGLSEEWVSKNLFLDLESIKRMQQLSGLKAAMNDIDDCDMAWSPIKDDSYRRKMTAYLIREATKYIEKYKKDHPDEEISSTGTAIDIALTIGFDKTEDWIQHGKLYTTIEKASA